MHFHSLFFFSEVTNKNNSGITFADGSVDTFIDRAKFIVTEEVE
jgi:hypothetical protein